MTSASVGRLREELQPEADHEADPLLTGPSSPAEHRQGFRRARVVTLLMSLLLLTSAWAISTASTAEPSSAPNIPPVDFPADGGGFHEVTPAQAGLDVGVLVSALSALTAHGKVGRVMVTRYGSHVQLPNGLAGSSVHNISQPAPIWSISKSLVALSAGLLLRNGSLGLDDTLPLSNDPPRAAAYLGIPVDEFEGAASDGPLRTLRQFLSMTSDFGVPGGEPGRNGAYNNAAVHYYGNLIAQEYYHLPPAQVSFKPAWTRRICLFLLCFLLQGVCAFSCISDTDIALRARGQMIEHLFSLVGGHQDQITLPTTGKLQLAGYGGGFHVSPRDLARLGVLLLADGAWKGERRLLDSSFVQDAMAPQAVGVQVCSIPIRSSNSVNRIIQRPLHWSK